MALIVGMLCSNREDGDDVETDLTSAGEVPERKPISKLGKSKSEETEIAEDRATTSSTGEGTASTRFILSVFDELS